MSNLVLACQFCNSKRGSIEEAEFRRLINEGLLDGPEYWLARREAHLKDREAARARKIPRVLSH